MTALPVDPLAHRRYQQALLWLTVAAVCWRVLLVLSTPVPAEDGVNYLWMAQRFAGGEAAAALTEPFAPLWPLLLALPIAGGIEPFLAGQMLGCLVGGLGILPIAAIAERLRPGAGLPAAALATTSSLLARTAPEVLTEPLFVLVAGLAVLAGVQQRPWRLGVLAAAAFWVRPEGLVVVAPFVLLRPRAAWPALPGLAAGVLVLGGWQFLCGHGFDPLPKLQFHALRDDLGPERGDLLGNLVQLPPVFLQAFAVAAVLAVLSAWPCRSMADRRGLRALALLLLIGSGVIVTFVVRRRFFVSWAAAVLPLAGVTVANLQRLGARGRELLLTAACGLDLFTAWNGTIAADRLAERMVGRYLAAHTQPDHAIVGDMTRVLWFAGQRPLPPRHFDAAWYLAAAKAPKVDYVVLHEDRRRPRGGATFAAVVAGLGAAFARLDLPPNLRDLAATRGIAVFVRR